MPLHLCRWPQAHVCRLVVWPSAKLQQGSCVNFFDVLKASMPLGYNVQSLVVWGAPYNCGCSKLGCIWGVTGGGNRGVLVWLGGASVTSNRGAEMKTIALMSVQQSQHQVCCAEWPSSGLHNRFVHYKKCSHRYEPPNDKPRGNKWRSTPSR